MIILTKEQAESVRGVYGDQELNPIELANGNEWVLPEDVIENEAFNEVKEILQSLPIREVNDDEFIQPEIE